MATAIGLGYGETLSAPAVKSRKRVKVASNPFSYVIEWPGHPRERKYYEPSIYSQKSLSAAYAFVKKSRAVKFIRNCAAVTMVTLPSVATAVTAINHSMPHLIMGCVMGLGGAIVGGISTMVAQDTICAFDESLEKAALNFEHQSGQRFNHRAVVAGFWHKKPEWISNPIRDIGKFFDYMFNTQVENFGIYMPTLRKAIKPLPPIVVEPQSAPLALPVIDKVQAESLTAYAPVVELLKDVATVPPAAKPTPSAIPYPSVSQKSVWQTMPSRHQKIAIFGGLLAVLAVGTALAVTSIRPVAAQQITKVQSPRLK